MTNKDNSHDAARNPWILSMYKKETSNACLCVFKNAQTISCRELQLDKSCSKGILKKSSVPKRLFPFQYYKDGTGAVKPGNK